MSRRPRISTALTGLPEGMKRQSSAHVGDAAAGSVWVVNYHYCQPADNGIFSGMKGVRPAEFERQMQVLAAELPPIAVGELEKASGSRSLVTFDDGTKDVFEHAIPVLRKFRTPAVLFCCTRPLLDRKVLHVQQIHLLQSKLGITEFRRKFLGALENLRVSWEPEDPDRLGLGHIYRYDDEQTRSFKFLLNVELPYPHLSQVLDTLFESEFGNQADIVDHIYMSTDDIKRCLDWGLDIGIHTHSHRMLSRLSRSEQEVEIRVPGEFLGNLAGDRPPLTMSYPYGVEGTWNAATKHVLADAGISVAFTLGRTPYQPVNNVDMMEVPRFDVNDIFEPGGALKVAS